MTPREPRVTIVCFALKQLLNLTGPVDRLDVARATPGPSPAKRVEAVRLERARHRLEAGYPSVESLARRCGFGRERNARRAFCRALGTTSLPRRQHSGAEEHGA